MKVFNILIYNLHFLPLISGGLTIWPILWGNPSAVKGGGKIPSQ